MKHKILIVIILFQIQNTFSQISDKQFFLVDILSNKNVIEIQTFGKQYDGINLNLLNGTDSIFIHKASSTYFNESNQPYLLINFEKLDTATISNLKHDQHNNLVFQSTRWLYGQVYKDKNSIDIDSFYINQDSFYIEKHSSKVRDSKLIPMTLQHRINFSENGNVLSMMEFENGKIIQQTTLDYNKESILKSFKIYEKSDLFRMSDLTHDSKGRLTQQIMFDNDGNILKEIKIKYKTDLNFVKKIYDDTGELIQHIETFEYKNQFGDLLESIEFNYIANSTVLKRRKYYYR